MHDVNDATGGGFPGPRSYRIPPRPLRDRTRVLRSPVVLAVIGSNLIRRPARTVLTATGIALGVATIVALLSVTAGLKRSAGDLIHLGDADLGIFQKGVADPTSRAGSRASPASRRPRRCSSSSRGSRSSPPRSCSA
jgi:hypothetical protein